jgi:hypothetical protein
MAVQSPHEATGQLPEFVLVALARNPSADPLYRKAAVEWLYVRGYNGWHIHPELTHLYEQVVRERTALNEVEAIVEAAVEAPMPESTGVKLENLLSHDFIDNGDE